MSIQVEVVYALKGRFSLQAVAVQEGATVQEALERSGLLERHPEIDLTTSKVGIFGKPVKLDHVLRERDRVEVYRPLKADPKLMRARRARAKQSKSDS